MSLIDELQGTACLTGAGFDANRFFELIEPSEIKDELIRNTERSVERGTCGSPTFEPSKYWLANLAVAIMAPCASQLTAFWSPNAALFHRWQLPPPKHQHAAPLQATRRPA